MVSRRARGNNTVGTRLSSLQQSVEDIKAGTRTPADDGTTERLEALEALVAQLSSANYRLEQDQDVNPGASAEPGRVGLTARVTAPDGWLICDGSAISRTTYAELFAAIGTQYGTGDGSTTFNIPNIMGRVPVGVDSGQAEFDTVGETGGAKTHTLSSAEMPSHTHTQNAHAHTAASGRNFLDVSDGTNVVINQTGRNMPSTGGSAFFLYAETGGGNTIGEPNGTTNTTATNQNTGGGGAHNNLQPYIALNYIIKT